MGRTGTSDADFDMYGYTTTTGLSKNINYTSTEESLTDYDDWANLNLFFSRTWDKDNAGVTSPEIPQRFVCDDPSIGAFEGRISKIYSKENRILIDFTDNKGQPQQISVHCKSDQMGKISLSRSYDRIKTNRIHTLGGPVAGLSLYNDKGDIWSVYIADNGGGGLPILNSARFVQGNPISSDDGSQG